MSERVRRKIRREDSGESGGKAAEVREAEMEQAEVRETEWGS